MNFYNRAIIASVLMFNLFLNGTIKWGLARSILLSPPNFLKFQSLNSDKYILFIIQLVPTEGYNTQKDQTVRWWLLLTCIIPYQSQLLIHRMAWIGNSRLQRASISFKAVIQTIGLDKEYNGIHISTLLFRSLSICSYISYGCEGHQKYVRHHFLFITLSANRYTRVPRVCGQRSAGFLSSTFARSIAFSTWAISIWASYAASW